VRLQLLDRPLGQVCPGQNAKLLHLGGCHRANAVEALDRQGGDKGCALVRRDDAEAVGLVLVARQLSDEFAIADTRGGREPNLRFDAGTYFLGDRLGAPQSAPVLGNVEIGFIEAERLDQVGIVGENLPYLL
jgi:hypothetical protein